MVCRIAFLTLGLVSCCTFATPQTHVDVDTSVPGVWSYTVFNDEQPGSPNYIAAFVLTVDGPISVTGTPDGWAVSTDNVSAVLWYNPDAALPYPHDIAPQSSLGGFVITSPGAFSASLLADALFWDHSTNEVAGFSDDLFIASPTVVPEAGTTALMVAPLFLLLFIRTRKPGLIR